MPVSSKSIRTVAITGASAGFGSRMAQAFAGSGFDLVLCGRNRERLNGVRDALQVPTARRCELLAADLRTAAGLDEFSDALQRHGVDIVVNNAAVNPELIYRKGLSSLNEIADVIATNASAAISVCLSAFEHLRARGQGTIVNVNSIAGWRGSGHEPVYAASKFGLRGFSESVKDAWLGHGVRIVDVYSGAIATGMSAGRSDLTELIDPGELAGLIVHLCDTHSFFVREVNIQKTPMPSRRARKVVFANGVFDILHSGHLSLLERARSIGDKLVVGINSDRAVRLLKGPDRPINDERARKTALECLRFVDEVVIFDQVRTTEIVHELMPDIIVKGDEYSIEEIRSTDKVPDAIDIITFPVLRSPDGVRISTTGTIAKMRNGH